MFNPNTIYTLCFHMRFVTGTRYQGTPLWKIDEQPSRDRFLAWVATELVKTACKSPVNELIVSAQWGEAMGISCSIEPASSKGGEVSRKQIIAHLSSNTFTFDSLAHQEIAYLFSEVKTDRPPAGAIAKNFLGSILKPAEPEQIYGRLLITADEDSLEPSDREILNVVRRSGLSPSELLEILSQIGPFDANP